MRYNVRFSPTNYEMKIPKKIVIGSWKLKLNFYKQKFKLKDEDKFFRNCLDLKK